jgi:hypothetical protein
MAAAQKAREALKAQGFNRVALDIVDNMHADTEFSQDYGFTVGGTLSPMDGTSNNPALFTQSVNSLSDIQSGDELREYKTRLIVYDGDSDPKQVENIVKDYISLA